mmetsp:Transcript_18593/g.46122  ORF Transcript_18593/g.46122 Transcript_18593/m.46122 type:complete len:332 (-) Transcript_18593:170-1165(-)
MSQLSILRGFDQFHGAAHSANLVLDGLEADQFRQGDFNSVIGRAQGIFNQLSFLLVFVAGGVTIFDSAHATSVSSSCLSDFFQHGIHRSGSLGVDSSRIEGVGVSLVNVQQECQDLFHFFRGSIGLAHVPGQLTFSGLVSALGLVQDFVFGGRDRLSLQHAHNIGGSSIGNGQIQRRVVIVVLLGRSLGVGIVQGFDHLQRCVVVSSVVEWQVSVVVLLGGSFGVNLEQKFFNLEGSLLPGGEMEGQVSVVVGDGCSFRVGLQERLCYLNGSSEGSSRMKRQVSSVIANLRLVLGGRVRGAANSGFPTLGQLVQVDVFSGGSHGCCFEYWI